MVSKQGLVYTVLLVNSKGSQIVLTYDFFLTKLLFRVPSHKSRYILFCCKLRSFFDREHEAVK